MIEESVEEPVEEVIEEIVEDPVEEVIEEIVEEPVEEVIEEIVEEPVEEVIEESVEEPVEEVEVDQKEVEEALSHVEEWISVAVEDLTPAQKVARNIYYRRLSTRERRKLKRARRNQKKN